MTRIRALALGTFALAAGAALALPAAAQSLGFGIEIGPRYEQPYYYPRYERPYYYAHPYGYPPPMPGNCYEESLNGRVCTY